MKCFRSLFWTRAPGRRRGGGGGVIASLHQVHLARAYADRIVALRDGRVLQDVPVAELDTRALEQIYGRNGDAA